MATRPNTPTHARYWVIFFAVTLSVVTYIDRVCISQSAPNIRRSLHLNEVEMGFAFAAFSWAYALFEIPSGWLGDWRGPRKVLMRIVLWWSFFTAATGWVVNLPMLVVVRFCFGAGEAGCFPNLTKAFTTWLPEGERVRAQGIMWASARWAGAFTYSLVALVLSYTTWRRSFGIFGLLGVVWAFFFYRWYRDNPRDHKSVNQAELELLEGADKMASGHGDVPWRRFLSSRTVWMLWAQYFCVSYGWYFYITWLPTYLQSGLHLSPKLGAVLGALPLFCCGVGSLTGGFISAGVARWLGSWRSARRLMAYVGCAGAGLFLLLSPNIRDPSWAMIAMGMAGFCNDIVMPGSWGACMDVGGKYAGTLSGSMNMMGNFAGGIAPVLVGLILRWTNQNWSINFYVSAGLYFLGVLCWSLLDPVTPLDRAEGAGVRGEGLGVRD
jgi:MFS family permease